VAFKEGERVQEKFLQAGQVETLRGELNHQLLLFIWEDGGRHVDVERSSLRRFLIWPR
jgi:hypothetical protein